MKFPNKYLRNLKPYTLASHKVWAVEPHMREDILKLDWNEATVPPTPLVKERILSLLSEPDFFNLYPTTYNERLHQLLADYVGLPKENVQYFCGSDALHEYICKVFISVGDPVLILGPSYDNFRLTCQANGANVFFSKYREDFSFDVDSFLRDIETIEPALVYLCNPNNPTGNLHESVFIEKLLKRFPDTLFLIDEAYYEFAGKTCKDLALLYDNILISRTMSKAFALANFRVGYLIASRDNVAFVNRIRNPKNLSTLAQEAAIAALTDIDYMKNYVEEVHKGMQYFLQSSERFKGKYCVYPGSGNFVLLKFPSYKEKSSLLSFLAQRNIFVRDTTQDSILKTCFRITVGTEEQMKRVISAISDYYAG